MEDVMKHSSVSVLAILAIVGMAASVTHAAEQANEIRCKGSGSTCTSGAVPVYTTSGGSATVGNSIITQSGSSITVTGTEFVTGDTVVSGNVGVVGSVGVAGSVTGAFVEGNANSGAGVQGTTSNGEAAVFGQNSTASGGNVQSAFGVQGLNTASAGIGVGGSSNSFGGISHAIFGNIPMGVIGDSSTGFAVVGASDNGLALVAENGSTDDTAVITNIGGGAPLFASGTGGSMFLDANGNLAVSGKITAGVKDFKIDHPLDPANKYLYHASVESSEMMNIYTGTAMMDMSGSAIVSLPDWFEAVNGDFRYQLTAIGAPAPNLHIAREIDHNQFVIAGGQAGMKVSWQVTGVRHDAYAKAHPLRVSVEKPEQERGYYLHPELYDAPADKSLAAAHMARVMMTHTAAK
jgi:hypothetical protein